MKRTLLEEKPVAIGEAEVELVRDGEALVPLVPDARGMRRLTQRAADLGFALIDTQTDDVVQAVVSQEKGLDSCKPSQGIKVQ